MNLISIVTLYHGVEKNELLLKIVISIGPKNVLNMSSPGNENRLVFVSGPIFYFNLL